MKSLTCTFSKVREAHMLVRLNDPYKYDLPKVCVVTYTEDECLLKLAFSGGRSSKIS